MTKGVLAILVDERIQTLEIVINFFAGAHLPIKLVSVGATSKKSTVRIQGLRTAMLFQKVLEVRVVALVKVALYSFFWRARNRCKWRERERI